MLAAPSVADVFTVLCLNDANFVLYFSTLSPFSLFSNFLIVSRSRTSIPPLSYSINNLLICFCLFSLRFFLSECFPICNSVQFVPTSSSFSLFFPSHLSTSSQPPYSPSPPSPTSYTPFTHFPNLPPSPAACHTHPERPALQHHQAVVGGASSQQ